MNGKFKKFMRDVAELLVTFRIATLTFLVWACYTFTWIVEYVMTTNIDSDWVLAFYASACGTLLPAIIKAFNDLRGKYEKDEHVNN